MYVTFPVGRHSLQHEAPIQVELIAPRGPVATAHITGSEPAQFRAISGTSYRVKVSGLGFDAVTTSYFEINPLEQLHTETVHVKLENQKQAGESTLGSSTISVSELNIPTNASTEMKKGLDATTALKNTVAENYSCLNGGFSRCEVRRFVVRKFFRPPASG